MESFLSILFWNICKKDLTPTLARLVRRHGIDIVVLAETGGEATQIRTKLATLLGVPVTHANRPTTGSKTQVYAIGVATAAKHAYTNQTGRLSLFHLNYPFFPEFAMATVHAASKNNETEESLA